ncbi:MAG: serine protease [Planctomycetota bacterium]
MVRVVVPEGEATSFGSGTLVDTREQFGLVVTNWHVVRDAQGPVEVLFPDGFRSKARPVKVDEDWDLAALVTWRPDVQPVAISPQPPEPGDRLTICGYGPGVYRSVTGQCTQYYSPRIDLPQQMVELDVEARQGDSGGPIFNSRGELAGVLFGAGQGTTLGSFGGRVENFLASIAPGIGRATDDALLADATPRHAAAESGLSAALAPSSNRGRDGRQFADRTDRLDEQPTGDDLFAAPSQEVASLWGSANTETQSANRNASTNAAAGKPANSNNLFEQIKSGLAVVGLVSLVFQVLKAAR